MNSQDSRLLSLDLSSLMFQVSKIVECFFRQRIRKQKTDFVVFTQKILRIGHSNAPKLGNQFKLCDFPCVVYYQLLLIPTFLTIYSCDCVQLVTKSIVYFFSKRRMKVCWSPLLNVFEPHFIVQCYNCRQDRVLLFHNPYAL